MLTKITAADTARVLEYRVAPDGPHVWLTYALGYMQDVEIAPSVDGGKPTTEKQFRQVGVQSLQLSDDEAKAILAAVPAEGANAGNAIFAALTTYLQGRLGTTS